VSTAHLYWNPNRPEVKLGQAKFLLNRIIDFIDTSNHYTHQTLSHRNDKAINVMNQNSYINHKIEEEIHQSISSSIQLPIILCGDFNSLPSSDIYRLITDDNTLESIRNQRFMLDIKESNLIGEILHGPNTKFLCDHSLSRLCRWLRILGDIFGIVCFDRYRYHILQ
jgi:mRNA deadenylase 3'-5' endonuclease subunit Ccr4